MKTFVEQPPVFMHIAILRANFSSILRRWRQQRFVSRQAGSSCWLASLVALRGTTQPVACIDCKRLCTIRNFVTMAIVPEKPHHLLHEVGRDKTEGNGKKRGWFCKGLGVLGLSLSPLQPIAKRSLSMSYKSDFLTATFIEQNDRTN